jgi:hypothetical protein
MISSQWQGIAQIAKPHLLNARRDLILLTRPFQFGSPPLAALSTAALAGSAINQGWQAWPSASICRVKKLSFWRFSAF